MTMAPRLQAPKGTADLFGEEMARFQFLEAMARRIFAIHGYEEMRSPVFEPTELFVRGIGEVTDIVSKEMYTFKDRSERSLTLRPEGTAGVVRAMLEHGVLKQSTEAKVFYMGPMFRYERPQKGRQRQFYQIGCEWFGNASPWADAETIAMLTIYLEACGFSGVRTRVNSIGARGDRETISTALRSHLEAHAGDLCEECQRRTATNPMRALDCKNPGCQTILDAAPPIVDLLSDSSQSLFREVCEHLGTLGVNFEVVPRLVRGFDYYTHTVFETALPGLGAQDAVLGGGRYDNLFEDLGGTPTPALGASLGVERLSLALQSLEAGPDLRSRVDVAICLLDEEGLDVAARLAATCRAEGLRVRFDYQRRSPKAALRDANRADARFAALLGTSEIEAEQVQLKDLESGDQSPVSFADLPNRLRVPSTDSPQ
jgi:histidyl-tRNA synthetase